MRQLRVFVLLLTLASTSPAVEALVVGGQVGHVGLTGSTGYGNAIGFGGALGVRVNPILDLVANLQHSSHSGGTNGFSQTVTFLSAGFRFWEINDFELGVDGGPGFYFLKTASSDTKFGLHAGVHGDVVVDELIRVGVGWTWHGVFSGTNYWTAMLRVGLLFGLGG